MRRTVIITASILSGLLTTAPPAHPQLPGGLSVPGNVALPTGGLSKDALLEQAQALVSDLTIMKTSTKLAPAQAKQAGDLLPKAQSLTGELEKPQIEPARLPQLAGSLSDLQKQASALKGLMK